MSDRKYRHHGYQDDDRDRDEKRRTPKPSGPRNYDDGPRGRGFGAPTTISFKCARCGRNLVDISVDKDTTCPGCQSPLHSCSNCSFFDTGARFECRKPREARIESKTKANDCEHFQPKAVRDLSLKPSDGGRGGNGGSSGRDPKDPRAAFDALFKK